MRPGNRFLNNVRDLNNNWVYSAPAVPPAGEARPVLWVNLMLAKRFGFDQKFNPPLAATLTQDEWDFDTWNSTIEAAHETAYNTWASTSTITPLNPPSWSVFKQKPVMRYNAVQAGPFQLWRDNNTNPFFLAASGKFEIYSNFLANPDLVADTIFTGLMLGGATGQTVTGAATGDLDTMLRDHRI